MGDVLDGEKGRDGQITHRVLTLRSARLVEGVFVGRNWRGVSPSLYIFALWEVTNTLQQPVKKYVKHR